MRQEYENIRVLVTGGAGFIGSHTVQTLIANGVSQVTILDNLSTGSWRKLLNIGGVKFRMGDIRSSVDVQAALEDVTHVIHLAAQVSVGKSIDEPALSADVNITGFVNLLDCARRANVKRIVYASSAAVYGNPAELPLQENSILAPLSPYGLEKQINDQYAALYQQLHGTSILGLRYFNVYGPGQDPASPYSGVISKFLDSVKMGQALTIFGDGEQTRDFVYVKDVALINVHALLSPETGVCNVATGQPMSLNQVVNTLSTSCGQKLPVAYRASRVGDIRHSRGSTS